MKEQNLTVVLGASEKPFRYSNMAVRSLVNHGYPVMAVGVKEGKIDGVNIQAGMPEPGGKVDTVTLYLSAKNQENLIDYILETLKPARIIFNPGAENPALEMKAKKLGISTENACTLVLLSTHQY